MVGETGTSMSSVLGPTAVVIGNVRGTGDFEVRGKVQGSIEITGRVLVADGGVVLGGIEATVIKVCGEVRGNLLAEDGVSIAASGRVEGDILAPRVGIEAGARVRGTLRTGGELPRTEDKPITQQLKSDSPHRDKSDAAPSRSLHEEPQRGATLLPESENFQAETTNKPVARPRKRKRPRPNNRGLSLSEASKAEGTAAKSAESKPVEREPVGILPVDGKRPRGPKGPPRVPTFEKGAKGRARS